MQVAISANKLLGSLNWAIYLGLCCIAGWFALESGALDNFFSKKTSLSMDEEISTERPVISITLIPTSGKEIILNNDTQIHYCPGYQLWQISCQILELGENMFFITQIEKTEKVLLERTQSGLYTGITYYRIIPMTELLEIGSTAIVKVLALKDSLNPSK